MLAKSRRNRGYLQAISNTYKYGIPHIETFLKNNGMNVDFINQYLGKKDVGSLRRAIGLDNPAIRNLLLSKQEKFVDEKLGFIKRLNPKLKSDSLLNNLVPYSNSPKGLPSWIENIGSSKARSVFETFFARHRSKSMIEELLHPQLTPIDAGRTRGPGTYAAVNSRISKDMYNFGANAYRMAMTPKMIKTLLSGKGYIRGTEDLNSLIARFTAESGSGITPELGKASGVRGGLKDIPWDHPFIQWAMKEGYVGYRHGENLQALTNWLIGTDRGYRLKPVARAYGGIVQKFANGGMIKGPGLPKSDSIFGFSQGGPLRLSQGEYVMKAQAVRDYTPAFMESVNRGEYKPDSSTVVYNTYHVDVSGVQDPKQAADLVMQRLQTVSNKTNRTNVVSNNRSVMR